MLRGEVHGALEPLVVGVHHLPRQPRQGLLDVEAMVLVGIEQIIVPEPVFVEVGGDDVHVETGQRVASQVHQPCRQAGQHL